MRAEEARLETVRDLSRETLEMLAPARLDTFDADFARWLLTAGQPQVREKVPAKPRPPDQALDTTLVAGMFFQVLMEAEQLPVSTSDRTSFVRKEVKNFLVQRLAGQITLSQFFRLMNLIEENITRYFDRLRGEWLPLASIGAESALVPDTKAATPEPVRETALREALEAIPLPYRENRKLSLEALLDFLIGTQGRWFRLLDFETYFQLNKKTAWVYLNQLLQYQIVRHNEQKANRVRYALAPRFLQTAAALPG